MKIAIWHHLPSGGGKRALYQHVEGLIRRGHQVECWCPATANREYLPLAALVPEHVVAYDKPAMPARPQKLGRYRQWKKEFAAMDRHCRLCADQINAGGFDVLFAGNCIDLAVAPIARHVRLPGLLYNQEPKRPLYEASPQLPWVALPESSFAGTPLHRVKEWLRDFDANLRVRCEAREERTSAEAFRLMLVNSAFSRESLLRAYGLDSKVCYLGIDAGLFRLGDAPREKYVVGLGAIQPHKGIETAVGALAAVPLPQRPKLVWIGNMANPDYQETVQQLAGRCGVDLEIRNMISDRELVDCLGRAAIMIYTSRLEPFGFAPLEANACGTPVVAIAEGGVRETIVHHVNGLLVPDRDPAALGQAVSTLLEDPKLARRLGETGAEEVRRRWTWEQSVERLEHHLFSLLGGV